MIREARPADIEAVVGIYDSIHTAEENGSAVIGWARNVYPTRETAEAALRRRDLFVLDEDEKVKAAAIINKTQVDVYRDAAWKFKAGDDRICVLHTLVVDPACSGGGIGKRFVSFYEKYALSRRCTTLRIDTNEKNAVARAMYKRLGYREADIAPCVFNGIDGVNLVLLEKKLK